jgi:hypothetical protein
MASGSPWCRPTVRRRWSFAAPPRARTTGAVAAATSRTTTTVVGMWFIVPLGSSGREFRAEAARRKRLDQLAGGARGVREKSGRPGMSPAPPMARASAGAGDSGSGATAGENRTSVRVTGAGSGQ